MAAPHSPIGSRRRLGVELRRLRNESGLTLDEVAEQMTCSTSKISRLETGKGIPKVPDVRELMRIYGVPGGAQQEELLRLVHDGREHGWWEPLTDGVRAERLVLDTPGRFAALENDATAVRSFAMSVVPGLLQTEAYTRAIIARWLPHHSAVEIDLLTSYGCAGRRRCTSPDPLGLVALIDEAVLRRLVGDAAVMAAQMDWLAELAVLPHIEIRVLPFGAGALRAHACQFGLLEIPPALGASVVYVETHAGESYLEGSSDVELYRDLHAEACREALGAAASRRLVASCAKVYRARSVQRRPG